MWGRKAPGVAVFPPHGALSGCYHSFNAKMKKPWKIAGELQEMENAKTPFRQSTTCLVTRRGQLSEGSVAGDAVQSSVCIKGVAENSVARVTAERVRGGQCLEAYHDFNTRATPPQGPPRVEKGVSSQNSKERGMHHAPPRSIIDFRKSTAREEEKTMFFKVPLRRPLTV